MNKKLIFSLLGTLLTVELAGSVYYLSRPLPLPQAEGFAWQGAALSIVPAEGTIPVGDSVFVKINLDTDSLATDGTRVVLRFDPQKIQVEEVNPGTIYSTFPVQEINNEEGRVVLSGIIAPNETPFQGSSTFATLKLKGVNTGNAALNFEFVPGVTTDSNVALHGKGEDILLKTSSAVYNVVER